MAKQKQLSTPSLPKGNDEGGKFVDRNYCCMTPDKAQEMLKPTPAEPVNMHKRMAGAC